MQSALGPLHPLLSVGERKGGQQEQGTGEGEQARPHGDSSVGAAYAIGGPMPVTLKR
jgi:hypothetical protein